MLVYSIDSKESFEEVREIYERIQNVKDEEFVPALLVGNKCDLEAKRKVSTWGECSVDENLFSIDADEMMIRLRCDTNGITL